jgi:hypothetical protein
LPNGSEFRSALSAITASWMAALHFVSFVDLTQHKEEQAHYKMLIDELNHRVKNTLSTVQSITWQAFRRSSDPEVIRESIESRLFAPLGRTTC